MSGGARGFRTRMANISTSSGVKPPVPPELPLGVYDYVSCGSMAVKRLLSLHSTFKSMGPCVSLLRYLGEVVAYILHGQVGLNLGVVFFLSRCCAVFLTFFTGNTCSAVNQARHIGCLCSFQAASEDPS